MKNISLILLVFLLVPIMGSAVITSSFSPLSIDVNNMSLISFDPSDPLSQPNLTTLTINTGNKRIDLKVRVNWNSSTLVEANFQHRAAAAPYAPFVTFSNRELISNEGHPDFEIKQGFPEITVSDVLDSKPLFKDAALSGTFPDGDLQIRIWVREYSTAGWTVPDSDLGDAKFTIKIRNAGTISLQTPGVAIGQNPPQISERPVSFIWNSVSTGFDENKSTITIREYPPNNPPNSSSIENTGNLFYTNIDVNSGFADFLPFNTGNYYAWQVSTNLFNEFNPIPHYRTQTTAPVSKSNWFVFRFVNESQNESQNAADMQAQLNFLNNSALRNLLTQGYTPVGTVIYEGRTYTGQDALDLLSALVGKELDVQLRD